MQETEEQKEGLYEKKVVEEYLGQRNLLMRMASKKFKKINVKLAGVNPRAQRMEDEAAARAKEESERAEKDKELQNNPASKLQKQLENIA